MPVDPLALKMTLTKNEHALNEPTTGDFIIRRRCRACQNDHRTSS
jgi:hypothetical protein